MALSLIVLAKGGISVAIAALAGYPARTALLTGVTLAQSAEFSFLLASVGATLGVLGPMLYTLLLAGAAVSILLSPSLHRAAAAFFGWLEPRLPLSPLAKYPLSERGDGERGPRGHAVLCGYGRVGQVIGVALERRRFPVVIIDQDVRKVRQLREQGKAALLGNAANPVLLERANLAKARVLVVAIPEALASRQIVDFAQRINPRLDIVVRTHSGTEFEFMRTRGVGEAVLGELELALEMTRHTLHRFGLSSAEVQAVVQGLRQRAEMEQQTVE